MIEVSKEYLEECLETINNIQSLIDDAGDIDKIQSARSWLNWLHGYLSAALHYERQ